MRRVSRGSSSFINMQSLPAENKFLDLSILYEPIVYYGGIQFSKAHRDYLSSPRLWIEIDSSNLQSRRISVFYIYIINLVSRAISIRG